MLTCSHVFFFVDLRGDDAAEARAKRALAHRRLGGDFEAKIGTRAHLLLADAPPRHTKGFIVLT
jgi:hypothetical protein